MGKLNNTVVKVHKNPDGTYNSKHIEQIKTMYEADGWDVTGLSIPVNHTVDYLGVWANCFGWYYKGSMREVFTKESAIVFNLNPEAKGTHALVADSLTAKTSELWKFQPLPDITAYHLAQIISLGYLNAIDVTLIPEHLKRHFVKI